MTTLPPVPSPETAQDCSLGFSEGRQLSLLEWHDQGHRCCITFFELQKKFRLVSAINYATKKLKMLQHLPQGRALAETGPRALAEAVETP
jgi:hypothetical protein